MNIPGADNPQVLSRKGDPVTGENPLDLNRDDSNERKAEIEGLKKRLEIAKTRKDINSIRFLTDRIKNLQLTKESYYASGLGRTGTAIPSTFDPSGDVFSQPQVPERIGLNDPEEEKKEKKTELDLLKSQLEVAKFRNDYNKVYELMNKIEGIEKSLKEDVQRQKDLGLNKLLYKAGKINPSSMRSNGKILLQWMRNKEARPEQKFGNQEVVFELSPETFDEYILPSERKYSIPLIKNTTSYEDMMRIIRSKIPEGSIYMKVFKPFNKQRWITVPSEDPPLVTERNLLLYSNKDIKWVIQVSSFDSPEAKLWGSIADSDVYENSDPWDRTTK